ncbi:MAG: hypothetical protein ACOCUD_03250 [Bacillota bacterium]
MQDEKGLLKRAVNYNQNILNEAGGDIDSVLHKIIYFDYKSHTIWNPFKDESLRYDVDPIEKYGENKIKSFLDNYKKLEE